MGQPQILKIDGELPGFNQLLDKAKMGRGAGNAYAKVKKIWTKRVHLECLAQKVKPVRRAYLSFLWREKDRRRDLDNVAAAKKLVIDGLVQAGILPNDGWDGVTGFADHFQLDPSSPGVTVSISEVL